ncbi:unnamed protein product, partial [Cyprideis torosa]
NSPSVSRTSSSSEEGVQKAPTAQSCDITLRFLPLNGVTERRLRRPISVNSRKYLIELRQFPTPKFSVPVFKGLRKIGEDVSFTSVRHPGSPFCLLIHEDSILTTKIVACCEARYGKGRRFGGSSGRYVVVKATGCHKCIKCQLQQEFSLNDASGFTRRERCFKLPLQARGISALKVIGESRAKFQDTVTGESKTDKQDGKEKESLQNKSSVGSEKEDSIESENEEDSIGSENEEDSIGSEDEDSIQSEKEDSIHNENEKDSIGCGNDEDSIATENEDALEESVDGSVEEATNDEVVKRGGIEAHPEEYFEVTEESL